MAVGRGARGGVARPLSRRADGGWNGAAVRCRAAAARDAPPQRRLYPCADGGAVFVDRCGAAAGRRGSSFSAARSRRRHRPRCRHPSADALECALRGRGSAPRRRAPREGAIGARPVRRGAAARRPRARRRAHPDRPRRRAAPTLAARAARPLSDVVVVELDDAIASPVAARTLADHGATVVKVVGLRRPRAEAIDAEANQEARAAGRPEHRGGRQRLWNLLKVADVVVDGGDDAAAGGGELGRHGFAPKRVLHRNPHPSPGASCFGHVGPPRAAPAPSERRASAAASSAPPTRASSAHAVLTACVHDRFLGAFGVLLALADRQVAAVEGKPFAGVLVLASLAQTATCSALGVVPVATEYVLRLGRLLWAATAAPSTSATALPPTTNAVEMPHTPARRHAYERWWPDDEILLPADYMQFIGAQTRARYPEVVLEAQVGMNDRVLNLGLDIGIAAEEGQPLGAALAEPRDERGAVGGVLAAR